jgi:hypothetical protein
MGIASLHRLSLRTTASYALAALADNTSRASQSLADFSEAFALHTLDGDERSALTEQLYARSPHGQRTELFAWEQGWLERSLPPAPARVLVGGAGHGREVRHLIARGYDVYAFDPIRAHAKGEQRFTLRYEQLARALAAEGELDPAALAASRALTAAAPFDAVLLGWLSLSHVTEARDQEALFTALDWLAPRAPILASFWMTGMRRAQNGTAHALGAALGARVRALRARTPLERAQHEPPPDIERLRCLPHAGFVYLFDHTRLEALARCAQRTLDLQEAADCPHATFAAR